MKQVELPLAALVAHVSNARSQSEYRRQELAELIGSIRTHGLLQPLVVARCDADRYTILAGHRRHAALKAMKLSVAPCVVLDEAESEHELSVLLTDNAQHQTVDPLKEADAIKHLLTELSGEKHPLDRVATLLGKSVAWVRARLRLTALSTSWRAAYGDPDHPINQFPVGHVELIAALSEGVQERAFQQWTGWWDEGVPLRDDLRRMIADLTADLGTVSWDLNDVELVPDAPACAACPKRDSVEGDLFKDLGGVRQATGDRCLDAVCFEAKRRAVVYRAIEEARAKYGDTLRLEVPWTHRDVPTPEDLKVHSEHELTRLTKAKGGFPVLRLRTMKVSYMGPASRGSPGTSGPGAAPLTADGKPKHKSMEERRDALRKRRLVRALDVFQGALMNRTVPVGTSKRPEELVPPEPQPPCLDALITYVLVYGTGPSVDPDGDGYVAFSVDNAEEMESLAKDTASKAKQAALRTRTRLWNRVREPIARSLRTFGGMSLTAAERMQATAVSVCRRCGLDWERDFHGPAVEAIPEPAVWSHLNEDGTRKLRERAG